MRKKLAALILLIFILVGCSTSSSNPAQVETATPTQTISSGSSTSNTGSFFAINEVGLGPDGYVALTNFTDQPANMNGLFLCQGAKCFELPSNVEVAPGTTVRIAVGNGTGMEGVVATGAAIGELRPSNGEIALFASKKLNDPKAILAYLEWGSTPHDNTQVAIDAGLWIKGAFAPSSNNATHIFHNEGGLWLFEE